MLNCEACGDPNTNLASRERGYRQYCNECYEELALGIIQNQNIHFVGRSTSIMEDDAGPWQAIAIRHMEDGFDSLLPSGHRIN